MNSIVTHNYNIMPQSRNAFRFLKFSEINFKGSTTILFYIAKIFFKNKFVFEINGVRNIWPIETVSDFRLLRGDYLGDINKYSLETGYEGVDLSYIKGLLNEGDIILDLGANKGFYTLFFSSFVGPAGKVFSFEASPDNFKTFLYRVKSLWNLNNVLPFNFILGNSNSELVSLTKPSIFDDGTGFYFKKTTTVSKHHSYTKTVDSLLNRLALTSIKMIKIDVEGAEFNVLSGARKSIGLADYVLVEVSNAGVERFGHNVNDLYKLLEELYFSFSYLISLDVNGNPILQNSEYSTGNVLFSKKALIVI